MYMYIVYISIYIYMYVLYVHSFMYPIYLCICLFMHLIMLHHVYTLSTVFIYYIYIYYFFYFEKIRLFRKHTNKEKKHEISMTHLKISHLTCFHVFTMFLSKFRSHL